MPDFTVARRGTDPNGRGIYASAFMWDWWLRVVDELGFTPVIVQGAHMTRAGGGATASAGYHDQGGCFDLRVWDRTRDEQAAMVRVLRNNGAAAWIRDEAHGGMDPHLHFVLGADKPLASGATYQWRQYLAGRDGLAGNGPDYHPRPSPLVTTPPAPKGLRMDKEVKAAFDALKADVADVRSAIGSLRQKEAQRFAKTIREQRQQGRDLDAILADIEAGRV